MRAHHRLEEPMAAVQAVARRAALHLQLVVPASVRRDVVRARAFVIQAGRGVPVVQVPHFVRPGPLVPATAHAAQRCLACPQHTRLGKQMMRMSPVTRGAASVPALAARRRQQSARCASTAGRQKLPSGTHTFVQCPWRKGRHSLTLRRGTLLGGPLPLAW